MKTTAAYRFHITNPDALDFVELAKWGKVPTLCHTTKPEAFVFDDPQTDQPMCPVCMKRREKTVGGSHV